MRSTLDTIPGVGPTRRVALLTHLGSVRRIRDATLAELEAVPGLGRGVAAAVYAHFHPGTIDAPSRAGDADAEPATWDDRTFDGVDRAAWDEGTADADAFPSDDDAFEDVSYEVDDGDPSSHDDDSTPGA